MLKSAFMVGLMLAMAWVAHNGVASDTISNCEILSLITNPTRETEPISHSFPEWPASKKLGELSEKQLSDLMVAVLERLKIPKNTLNFAHPVMSFRVMDGENQNGAQFLSVFSHWAIQRYNEQHPNQDTAISSSAIFHQPGMSKKIAMNEWKRLQGVPLEEGTILLSQWPEGKSLRELNEEELNALLVGVMQEQEKRGASKTNHTQFLSTKVSNLSGREGVTVRTIVIRWAALHYKVQNQPSALDMGQQKVRSSLSKQKEIDWLIDWKKAHGFLDPQPLIEGAQQLTAWPIEKKWEELTARELEAMVVEATGLMGKTVGSLNINHDVFQNVFTNASGSTSLSFASIFKRWAIVTEAEKDRRRRKLTVKEIFDKNISGKTMADWLGELKKKHNVDANIPGKEKPVALKSWPARKTFLSLSGKDLDSMMVEGVLAKKIAISEVRTSPIYMNLLFLNASGRGRSKTLGSMVRQWAVKTYQAENPTQPALTTAQIYNFSLSGRTEADWLEYWRETHLKAK